MAHESITIDLRKTEDDRFSLFTLRGSLDLATAPSVRAALIEALDEDARGLVVDLSQVDFLDSTGLSALIGARKRATERSGEIRLIAQEGRILRLLRITGLADVFAVYPTLGDALADETRLAGL